MKWRCYFMYVWPAELSFALEYGGLPDRADVATVSFNLNCNKMYKNI